MPVCGFVVQPYVPASARVQFPEDMQEGYGYPPLTDEDRAKIFGKNLAGLLGIMLPGNGRNETGSVTEESGYA